MAAIEQADLIFRLPDELLMRICSYITSIKSKMELEQVCQRFNYVSSSHPSSWKGVHSLQLMIKCDFNYEISDTCVLKTNCDMDNVHLNGVAVRFDNWPKAIESFLHRTQLRHFTIHFGNDIIYSLFPSTNIFHDLLEIFGQNRAKVKIESIEIHCANNLDIDKIDGFRAFILDLFNSASPHLHEIRYFAESSYIGDGLGTLIWPIIHKCNKLKSICYRDRNGSDVNFTALIGKPLTEMVFYNIYSLAACLSGELTNPENIVNVINGVSGGGLQSLTVGGNGIGEFFAYLNASHLTENARNKLKCLSLSNNQNDDVTQHMALIPMIFPNIERCDMQYSNALPLNQFSPIISDFFELSHDGPITRRFIIRYLDVGHDEPEFKVHFTQFCHNNQIDIDFGEMQPTPYAYLSKGKASLVIWNIEIDDDYSD